jgi:branched-chain amino acid transport system substrate-binding protein
MSIAGQPHYDFLKLLAETIETVGSTDPTEVKDALQQVTNWVGLSGTFNFSAESHSGLATDSITLASIASIKDAESEGKFLRELTA